MIYLSLSTSEARELQQYVGDSHGAQKSHVGFFSHTDNVASFPYVQSVLSELTLL